MVLLDACHLQMQASKQERALCKLSKPQPHKLRIAKLLRLPQKRIEAHLRACVMVLATCSKHSALMIFVLSFATGLLYGLKLSDKSTLGKSILGIALRF